MSDTGPFAAAIDHAQQWLGEIADALGTADRDQAWSVTRAILQTVRDHLPHEEAAHLAAPLPQILRGAFYEGWRPDDTPMRVKRGEEFLAEIAERLHPRPLMDLDLLLALQGVLAGLVRCGMGPSLAHVQGLLPKGVQELWRIPTGAPG